MKNKWSLSLLLFGCLLFSACANDKQASTEHAFTSDYLENLKNEALNYDIDAYSNQEVPFNSVITLTGTITTADSKSAVIKENDRFILTVKGVPFHIINGSQTEPQLQDTVTIYGEYNGLTVASLIEIE